MMPQTSVDNAQLEPVVEKLTKSMQKIGYFGYLYVDLYCYPHAQEDKIEVLFVETNPYYGHGQHFADWMNLAIHGSYDRGSNSFDAGISVAPDIARQRSTTLMSSTRLPRWNETTKRYGIAVEQLYHPKFSNYSWKKLRALTRNSGVKHCCNAHLLAHPKLILMSQISVNCAVNKRLRLNNRFEIRGFKWINLIEKCFLYQSCCSV